MGEYHPSPTHCYSSSVSIHNRFLHRKSPQIQTSDILLLTLFVCCFFGSGEDEGGEAAEEGEEEDAGEAREERIDYGGLNSLVELRIITS